MKSPYAVHDHATGEMAVREPPRVATTAPCGGSRDGTRAEKVNVVPANGATFHDTDPDHTLVESSDPTPMTTTFPDIRGTGGTKVSEQNEKEVVVQSLEGGKRCPTPSARQR